LLRETGGQARVSDGFSQLPVFGGRCVDFTASMAWPAGTVPDHEALIAKYRELASEGKREEIIKEADRIVEQSREVIREKPGTDEAIRARLNMALLYGVYGKGEFAEAEAIFTALIREHSDHALMPAVRYYYGKTIAVGWRAERWDEALKVFDGVARDYPKSEYAARATIERANWCRHLGEREEAKRREAIALYKRIVSKYPDTASGTESAYALFGLAMREHDLAEAKEWLDRIEKLHHPLAKENYALAYPRWAAADVFLNTTTLDEAVPVVTSALAAMTSDERTLEFLAALGEMNARAEEGEKRWDLIGYCLEEALATLEADTQPPVLLRLANLYASGQLGKARTDDGARLWEQLKQEHPASPEALEAALRLADYDRRRYEQFGRKPEDREWLQKAIAAYEEIVSKNPDSRHAAASLHALVALYLDEGDESRATSCLDRLAASTWPAAKGWYEEDRLRVLTRHVLKADAELGELQANIDRQLELLEEGDAKREFLWAIVRGSGALPEENGTRWHVVASCYETIVETASGEERTKAMFNLAQVYFYHHVGEDKPEKGIALLEQIKAEHAGQPWALRAEMAITGYLYHISWDVPRKKEARRDVLQRFLAIADKHAGSEEASRALFTLACHYTVREYFDPEKATAFGLRFLDENPKRNAPRYTEFVTRVRATRSGGFFSTSTVFTGTRRSRRCSRGSLGSPRSTACPSSPKT